MSIIYHLPEKVEEITITLIESLIANEQKEDSLIDYKGKRIPKDISNIVCSFLNNLGGHIIFGMEEKKNFPTKIIGIHKTEMKKLNTRLKSLKPHIDLIPHLKEIRLTEDLVLSILFIPRYPNQWFLSKGRFYVRRGDSSDPIDSETEIETWKNNHPENRIELKTIIDKLQANTDIINKLKESKDQHSYYIPIYLDE